MLLRSVAGIMQLQNYYKGLRDDLHIFEIQIRKQMRLYKKNHTQTVFEIMGKKVDFERLPEIWLEICFELPRIKPAGRQVRNPNAYSAPIIKKYLKTVHEALHKYGVKHRKRPHSIKLWLEQEDIQPVQMDLVKKGGRSL